MAQATQTLEGWYCLHDFRKIDWIKWKSLSDEERQKILAEFLQLLDDWSITQNEKMEAMVCTRYSDKKQI